MNIDEIRVNENALCVIKQNHNNKLYIDAKYFSNIYAKELNDFEVQFNLVDKNSLFKLNDLQLLKVYIKDKDYLNEFDNIRDFKYCEDIRAAYQGFEVNIEKEIKLISNEINSITSYLNKFEEGNSGKTIVEEESYLVKNILSDYFRKLKLWTRAYSINKAYKECLNDPNILFYSHRILGWSKPEKKLHKDLSIEFKTNFGFGHSSYFFLKLKYKNIDIVSFVDAIQYPYWSHNENVFYTRRYNLQQDKFPGSKQKSIHNIIWLDAFKYTSWAVNLLNKSTPMFIEKVLVKELKKLTSYLENLSIINLGTSTDVEQRSIISITNDIPFPERTDLSKFLNTNLQINELLNPEVEELFHLCNTFNFIPIIEKYSEFILVKDTVDMLFHFATEALTTVPDVILRIEKKISLLKTSIEDLKYSLSLMKDKHVEYESALKRCSNKEQFKKNEGYITFYEKRKKLFELLDKDEKEVNVNSNDLKRCKNLHNQIIRLTS